jgi:RDD family
LPDLTDSVEFLRGGFWRRALAMLIDLIAIAAVLQLAALALFPLSNGHVQFSGGPFYALNCQKLDQVPDGVRISAGFGADTIADCRQSLLGLPTARSLTVSRITRDGAVTRIATVRHMLDAQGKPTGGWPLDIFILPLLIGLRFWLDRIGGSPGRRICRIGLSDGMNGHYPPPATLVNRRYVALALPLAPPWIWSAYGTLFPGSALVGASMYWLCWVGTGLPLLIAALEAADSIIRRRDTFYDRFAQTSVLRLDKKNAAMMVAVAALSPRRSESNPSRPPLIPEASAAYAQPPPLPPQIGRSRNYIARHWRGELSLPVSYWLNGILCGVVVGATVTALAYATNGHGDAQPLMWLFSLIATWISAALLTLWQSVGVWRSATRYRQSGRRYWGEAAKALVLLGVAQLAANFVMVGAAQLAGIYEIVAGDALVGPHEFHILANGQTLEFSGGITFGVEQELERFLDAMAGVRTVQLNSAGGRVLEAQKMSDLIRSRNLATFVARDCLSACTIVFLGGKERFMLPTARLGFHQPAFRGMTAADRRAAIATEEQRLSDRFGLSKAFASRANSAAPSAMWYPDVDELVRERVVTRLISPEPPPPADGKATAADSPAMAAITPLTPAAGIPGARAAAPAAPAAYGTVRTKIPADLLKRLSATPRKPAIIAPAAEK